jgi:hypothetical protein
VTPSKPDGAFRDVVAMRTVGQTALCGLVLLCLVGCGSGRPDGSAPATTASTVTTPAITGGASQASVAKARATISTDGLEFVGADTVRIGVTIEITITNQESGPVEVRLLNPSGSAASHAEISAGGSGQISATVDVVGTWTVTFKDKAGELTKTITVH